MATFYKGLLVASFLAVSCASFAQDLDIVTGDGVTIPDGSAAPSGVLLTDFGAAQVNAGSIERNWWVVNRDQEIPVSITEISISGAHATDFSFTPEKIDELSYGVALPLYITFAPTAPGLRTATVTIKNTTPGAKADYTINVQGTGVADTPGPTADLDLVGTPPKIKRNEKKGLTSIKWKIAAVNLGPVPANNVLVRVYFSPDNTVNPETAIPLAEYPIKPLPAFEDGQKLKSKKLNFKTKVPETEGTLYAVISQPNTEPVEEYYGNNVETTAVFLPLD